MIVLLSIVAAVIPAGLYIGITYWFDHYEKEPAWLLMATFLWGAVPSIILALIFNLLGALPFYLVGGAGLADAAGAVLVAPVVEETIKALALLGMFLLNRQEIDSLLDGIIYGAMVGMGFAMVENVFYFVEAFNSGGFGEWGTLVFLRAVLFGLNHSLFTAMTGLGFALARHARQRWVRFVAIPAGWLTAIFLHFTHNLVSSFPGVLCLILPFTDWGGVLLLLLIVVWSLTQEKRWISQYLAEEVGWGTLTARQYERAQSSWLRSRHRFNALVDFGPGRFMKTRRFYHLCSELAYKKRHFAQLQDHKSDQLTHDLRRQLADLSRQIG